MADPACAESDTGIPRLLKADDGRGQGLAALFEPDTEQLRVLIDRATARGELAAPPAALELLPGLVAGGLALRPIYEGGQADAALAHRFVDHVLIPVLNSH